MSEVKISRVAKLIIAAGRLLTPGERWQSPFARITGLSPGHIQNIASGARPVTDDVGRVIAKALFEEAEDMRRRARNVQELGGKIMDALEK